MQIICVQNSGLTCAHKLPLLLVCPSSLYDPSSATHRWVPGKQCTPAICKVQCKVHEWGSKNKTKTSIKRFRMSRVQWTKKVPKVEWRNLKSSSNEEPHSRSMHSWRKAFKYTCFSLLNTWPTVEILKSSGFALVKWAIRQSNRWRKKVVNYTSKVRLR